jgi:hypothetical protein
MNRCQSANTTQRAMIGEPAIAPDVVKTPDTHRQVIATCQPLLDRPARSGPRSSDAVKALGLAVGVLLAACASPPPPGKTPPQARVVPFELRRCPEGRPSPVGPPPPRTVQQLIDWTSRVHGALVFTERARAECASRLNRLNDWIAEGSEASARTDGGTARQPSGR